MSDVERKAINALAVVAESRFERQDDDTICVFLSQKDADNMIKVLHGHDLQKR